MLLFQINTTPWVSVNALYMTRGRYRILTPEAKKYKAGVYQEILNQIELQDLHSNDYTAKIQALKGQSLCLFLRLYSDSWHTKTGSIRKVDAASFEKATIDSLFDALQTIDSSLDDSAIFGLAIQKVVDTEQRMEVEIMPVGIK